MCFLYDKLCHNEEEKWQVNTFCFDFDLWMIYKETFSYVSWMRSTVQLVTPKASSYWNIKHLCSKSKETLIQANLKNLMPQQAVASDHWSAVSMKQSACCNHSQHKSSYLTGLLWCIHDPGTTSWSIEQGTSLINWQTLSILPTSVNCAMSPQCQTPTRTFITPDTQRRSGQDWRHGGLL